MRLARRDWSATTVFLALAALAALAGVTEGAPWLAIALAAPLAAAAVVALWRQ